LETEPLLGAGKPKPVVSYVVEVLEIVVNVSVAFKALPGSFGAWQELLGGAAGSTTSNADPITFPSVIQGHHITSLF
jgi:hypothetical protein